jgi:hypothetical protein
LICSDPGLSEDDLRFREAYEALRQQSGEAGQRQLRQEAVDFDNSVLQLCGVPATGSAAGSPDCVGAQYDRQRSYWAARLTGAASEEANRGIERHIALQRDLCALGYCASADFAGVYGPGTRNAIVAWQKSKGKTATGFIGDADAAAIEQEASNSQAASPSTAQAPISPAPAGGTQQQAISSDPLLEAVHRHLVKNAHSVCENTVLSQARKVCFDEVLKVGKGLIPKDELLKQGEKAYPQDCPENIVKTFRSICPDGPDKLVELWETTRAAQTVSFRDFVLNKEELATPDDYGVGKPVIVRGVYIRAQDSLDYLLAPGQINPMAFGRRLDADNAIPLLLDESGGGTERESREALLACRQKYPSETFTGCSVMLSGFVQRCDITTTSPLMSASHEAVCIKVSEVVVNPRS